jgi:hypothetical protein
MFFYWGFNSKMSYLNYLTLLSFSKLNPDWKLYLYRPRKASKHVLSQHINDIKHEYIGPDYSKEISNIDNLEVIEFDFDTLNIENERAEVYKSDILRWYLLSTLGGGWSDMDILYFKPISAIRTSRRMIVGNSKEIDTCIIFKDYGYHPIGFYLSSEKNPFFAKIFKETSYHFNPLDYQSVGKNLLNKLYPSVSSIKCQFPELNICDLAAKTVYPYRPREIQLIFNYNIKLLITKETIGIHWYNGSKISKDFNNNYQINKGKLDSFAAKILSFGKKTATIQDYIDYINIL